MSELQELLQQSIDDGTVPGAVALVARGDDVVVETVGDLERSSIVRIASIGKPITAAAVMLLVDDGVLGLEDELGRFFPELASPMVVRTPESTVDDVVPAERPITVRDVLESRAGWGFPADFSLPAVQLLVQRALPITQTFASTDAWVAGLARVPLLAQPGSAWLYNACSDLQGALVERATSRSLPDFMRERIFEPLGMHDTAFDEPGFASGAGGLVSTADDLLAFGRMLLAHGEPILSEDAVRLMTTDHLTAEQRDAGAIFLDGLGWGYGGSVDSTRGLYGWVGGTGTTAHVAFPSNTVAVLLTQVQMAGPTPTPLMRQFWSAAGL